MTPAYDNKNSTHRERVKKRRELYSALLQERVVEREREGGRVSGNSALVLAGFGMSHPGPEQSLPYSLEEGGRKGGLPPAGAQGCNSSACLWSSHTDGNSQALQESGDRSHWCVVAYWEEKTRVGRLYSVQEPSLDIFYDLPQGNGFCLGQLSSDNKSTLVQMVRTKIGYGIQLSREPDGVWVYNRSCYPIFIKSATLDNPDSRTLLVHKVFPGFSIKAFDFEKADSLQRPNDHEFTQQPRTGFTVQISFVKGWGQCYTRQFISSCPCWLEVIFNNR
ncbi:unnamed protein product [Coregonus sp. 'balchen']|nr:unnamed protein product [Coregonus sp. 'balchen']